MHDRLRLGDRLRLLGHRDDVPGLLAAADVFISANLFDGMLGAVIEAMAMALPVVASDLPAIREVADAKESALLVPPGDEAALAAAITRLLEDSCLRRRLGLRGRAIFDQRFTLQGSLHGHLALYAQLARGQEPRVASVMAPGELRPESAAMRAARRMLRGVQRLLPASRGGVTVLAYHLVGGGTSGPVDLDRDIFRRQMEELAATARVVPLDEATDGTKAQPRRQVKPLVVLTFDDAYANFFEHAWPVLEELSLPATLFVPVGFVDGTHPPPIVGTDHLPAASWQALSSALPGGLLSIGSHSWTHRDLRQLADDELDREFAAARRHVGERLGVEVDAFCYPRALWDRRLEQRVAAEFAVAVVGGGRRWAPPQSPWRVQRVSLRRDGPVSLAPILAAPVWLEEWAADRLRRARPRQRSER